MSESKEWFTIGFTSKSKFVKPSEKVMVTGIHADDPKDFAQTLFMALYAMRISCDGHFDTPFGGWEPVEMVARLVIAIAEKELEPGGFWSFVSPDHAESGGFGERLAAVNSLLSAARHLVKLEDDKDKEYEAKEVDVVEEKA